MKVKMMATNGVFANYQEIVDISTTPDKVGIFGIHTPDTIKPIQMLEGFYRQFRQVKYLGCDVKIQPAATLPMDPLGVSYEAGEVATDPRDLLNPIMVKGCHGETINRALDVAYRDNQNIGDALTRTDYAIADGVDGGSPIYYSALSDPSFKKYSVLQPFALRNLHPLVHKVVATLPIYPKQSVNNWQTMFDGSSDTEQLLESSDWNLPEYADNDGNGHLFIPSGPESAVGPTGYRDYLTNTLFTSKMEGLGWIDTVSRPQENVNTDVWFTYEQQQVYPSANGQSVDINNGYKFNTIPRLFMSMMIMPPCYKSILTFRVVLNHKFAFRGFSTARRGNLIDEAYSADLADVTGTASAVSTTSIDTINGTSAPVTDGVY
nr:MAG: capsid protein [Canine associated porprismacovirus]